MADGGFEKDEQAVGVQCLDHELGVFVRRWEIENSAGKKRLTSRLLKSVTQKVVYGSDVEVYCR